MGDKVLTIYFRWFENWGCNIHPFVGAIHVSIITICIYKLTCCSGMVLPVPQKRYDQSWLYMYIYFPQKARSIHKKRETDFLPIWRSPLLNRYELTVVVQCEIKRNYTFFEAPSWVIIVTVVFSPSSVKIQPYLIKFLYKAKHFFSVEKCKHLLAVSIIWVIWFKITEMYIFGNGKFWPTKINNIPIFWRVWWPIYNK